MIKDTVCILKVIVDKYALFILVDDDALIEDTIVATAMAFGADARVGIVADKMIEGDIVRIAQAESYLEDLS